MADPVIIDSHMHVYKTKEEGYRRKISVYPRLIWEYGEKPDVQYSEYDGDLSDVLESMKKGGYSKAVLVHHFGAARVRQNAMSRLDEGLSSNQKGKAIREIDLHVKEQLKEFNKWGCQLTQGHPELVPFINADPRALPGQESAEHIRDMVESYGAKGIKLHPVTQQFFMSDKVMWPIYETCIELGIPIVAHTGPAQSGGPSSEPETFAGALEAFPDLTIVLAHMGGGAWQQTLEIAERYPNAYFDCCEIMEWIGAPNAPTDQQFAQLIRDIGPERVLLGTDFPWYDLSRSVEIIMSLPVLSKEEKEGILGANALRVLGV